MNPRKFYLGFPPAIVKTKRNGIEYGVGAIPLGGYVKIPGMHRPAAGDLDVHFGRAVEEQPSLRRPVERSAASASTRAITRCARAPSAARRARRSHGTQLVRCAPPSQPSAGSARSTTRSRPDAYWRAKTWKRVAVIFAGPGAESLLAVDPLRGAVHAVGGRLPATVDEVVAARHRGCDGPASGGRRCLADRRPRAGRPRDRDRSRSSTSTADALDRHGRARRSVRSGSGRPSGRRRADGSCRLGFVLAGERTRVQRRARPARRSASTGIVTQEIGASLEPARHRRRAQARSRARSGSCRARRRRSTRATDTYLWVLGLISLSLALLNLLPLLPLDGGHIAFSLDRGDPRPGGRRARSTSASRRSGSPLVLLLFFIGLSNDIGRLAR